MHTVTKFQTFDGALHDSQKSAERHLENLTGELLCSLARKIVGADWKYTKVLELLEAETETMRRIVQIKDDSKLLSEE